VLEPGWKLCPYCAHDLKARRIAPPVEGPPGLIEVPQVQAAPQMPPAQQMQ
jgi:hypothetical protein